MIERRGSPLRRFLRLIVNVAILIVLVNGLVRAAQVFVTHPVVNAARVTRTAFELQQIATVIEEEELLTGSYPTDFRQFMSENFYRKRGSNTTVDPWGKAYQFTDGERDFVVRSAGPDGVPRTADDIYITRTKPRWKRVSGASG
jgi:hypothetical protein